MLKKSFQVLSFFALILMSLPAQAGNGLWVDGKDQPKSRVNTDTKELSLKAYSNVVKAFKDSVVNISTTQKAKAPNSPQMDQFRQFFGDDFFEKFFGGPQGQMPGNSAPAKSLGSGFIISKDGYVVTNNHVVDAADEIKVTLSNDNDYVAKLIGKDPKTDLALLKIETKSDLNPVILGDSSAMGVGDIVVAIGNPFGLSYTTTQGIISAKERTIGFGAYDDFIQTDASINPGNSGGPLMNIYGEVIGINSAIVASGQGIGFAIPINLAKDILLKLKKDGKVTRSWLGVMIQKVTEDHASALKLPKRMGALISEVVPNGPAGKAGIQVGDVITKFNDKTIEDWHQLPIAVASADVGSQATVEVYRDGKAKSFTLKLEAMKDEKANEDLETKSSDTDKLDLVVEDLQPQNQNDKSNKSNGVRVAYVGPKSPLSEKGLNPGDVIIEINRQKINSKSDYVKVVQTLKPGSHVLMLVRKNRVNTFVAFTMPK